MWSFVWRERRLRGLWPSLCATQSQGCTLTPPYSCFFEIAPDTSTCFLLRLHLACVLCLTRARAASAQGFARAGEGGAGDDVPAPPPFVPTERTFSRATNYPYRVCKVRRRADVDSTSLQSLGPLLGLWLRLVRRERSSA